MSHTPQTAAKAFSQQEESVDGTITNPNTRGASNNDNTDSNCTERHRRVLGKDGQPLRYHSSRTHGVTSSGRDTQIPLSKPSHCYSTPSTPFAPPAVGRKKDFSEDGVEDVHPSFGGGTPLTPHQPPRCASFLTRCTSRKDTTFHLEGELSNLPLPPVSGTSAIEDVTSVHGMAPSPVPPASGCRDASLCVASGEALNVPTAPQGLSSTNHDCCARQLSTGMRKNVEAAYTEAVSSHDSSSFALSRSMPQSLTGMMTSSGTDISGHHYSLLGHSCRNGSSTIQNTNTNASASNNSNANYYYYYKVVKNKNNNNNNSHSCNHSTNYNGVSPEGEDLEVFHDSLYNGASSVLKDKIGSPSAQMVMKKGDEVDYAEEPFDNGDSPSLENAAFETLSPNDPEEAHHSSPMPCDYADSAQKDTRKLEENDITFSSLSGPLKFQFVPITPDPTEVVVGRGSTVLQGVSPPPRRNTAPFILPVAEPASPIWPPSSATPRFFRGRYSVFQDGPSPPLSTHCSPNTSIGGCYIPSQRAVQEADKNGEAYEICHESFLSPPSSTHLLAQNSEPTSPLTPSTRKIHSEMERSRTPSMREPVPPPTAAKCAHPFPEGRGRSASSKYQSELTGLEDARTTLPLPPGSPSRATGEQPCITAASLKKKKGGSITTCVAADAEECSIHSPPPQRVPVFSSPKALSACVELPPSPPASMPSHPSLPTTGGARWGMSSAASAATTVPQSVVMVPTPHRPPTAPAYPLPCSSLPLTRFSKKSTSPSSASTSGILTSSGAGYTAAMIRGSKSCRLPPSSYSVSLPRTVEGSSASHVTAVMSLSSPRLHHRRMENEDQDDDDDVVLPLRRHGTCLTTYEEDGENGGGTPSQPFPGGVPLSHNWIVDGLEHENESGEDRARHEQGTETSDDCLSTIEEVPQLDEVPLVIHPLSDPTIVKETVAREVDEKKWSVTAESVKQNHNETSEENALSMTHHGHFIPSSLVLPKLSPSLPHLPNNTIPSADTGGRESSRFTAPKSVPPSLRLSRPCYTGIASFQMSLDDVPTGCFELDAFDGHRQSSLSQEVDEISSPYESSGPSTAANGTFLDDVFQDGNHSDPPASRGSNTESNFFLAPTLWEGDGLGGDNRPAPSWCMLPSCGSQYTHRETSYFFYTGSSASEMMDSSSNDIEPEQHNSARSLDRSQGRRRGSVSVSAHSDSQYGHHGGCTPNHLGKQNPYPSNKNECRFLPQFAAGHGLQQVIWEQETDDDFLTPPLRSCCTISMAASGRVQKRKDSIIK